MKHSFLYRLFKHSLPAFVFAAIFLLFYAITINKKMDMIFFPYNNMYAIDFSGTSTSSTYAMKINGNQVTITHNLYWKKDLLETSLNGYCRYLQHNRKVFLDDYLSYKFSNEQLRNLLTSHLTPDDSTAVNWPYWFAKTAGYTLPAGSEIEFLQYHFNLRDHKAVLLDSVSIYKTILK